MNKKIAAVVTVGLVAGAFSAFGQGYTMFGTPMRYVYDAFSTPGTGVVAPGDVDAAFLWAAVGTADPLGAGVSTSGNNGGTDGVTLIDQMLGNGWTEGYNYNGGGPVEAVTAVNGAGLGEGGIAYKDGTSFQLNGSTAGDAYEIVVVGWDNMGGTVTSLATALADGGALGWSGSFTYQTGAYNYSPIANFSQSGMTPFGVAPVPGSESTDPAPEPTTLALAGLGGLSMLLRRRSRGLPVALPPRL